MSFQNRQKYWQDRVNLLLNSQFEKLDNHSQGLKEAMNYALLNGGKRMRPFLVYATGELLGVPETDLDAPAQAIECIHSYSLVHDDLPAMDDDELRRGKPTCHIAFDEATAILAGDALQTMAFDILAQSTLSSGAEYKHIELVKILAQASGYSGMCGGQAMDLSATGKQITQSELQLLHSKKTGALIKASVDMACCLAENLPLEHREALSIFALRIGLAFQVQDDILDVIGDSDTLGKPQGSDMELQKSTYPALLGLEGAKAFLDELHKQALQALSSLPYNTQVLESFADFNVRRNH